MSNEITSAGLQQMFGAGSCMAEIVPETVSDDYMREVCNVMGRLCAVLGLPPVEVAGLLMDGLDESVGGAVLVALAGLDAAHTRAGGAV